jgi:hypothetical protein
MICQSMRRKVRDRQYSYLDKVRDEYTLYWNIQTSYCTLRILYVKV